ncbi:hypothetical protein LPUS_10295 [Lasallia pustulata]|uniref:Rhodopsin domain-containing protein n=1 Tax=Lasallia pustulata TaxID=136370 RepID=A0A1W5D979_9LECA|nr:hypothetical protein LPUS_10295 [Lasallia pustulata]
MLPGLAPPPGVTPDFVHPYSLQKYNVITLTVCMTIHVSLHGQVDSVHVAVDRQLAYNHLQLGLVAIAALNFPLRANGDGVHQWNVPLSHLIRWAQYANALEILLCVVTLFTRASIILLYERIFAPNRISRLYIITQLMFYINIGTTSVFMFIFIFQCVPRSKIWDPTKPGHCLDIFAIYKTSGIFSVGIDSVLFILPQYSIWNLQMSWKQRAKASAAFAMAVLAPVASTFRLVTGIRKGKNPDMTYATFPIGLWSAAELTTGIVCSCFPAFRAFTRVAVPKIASKLSSIRSSTASTKPTPSSATSSRGPKPNDPGNRSDRSYHELGSISYHDYLPNRPSMMTAEQVLADGGIWKSMMVESEEEFAGMERKGRVKARGG